MNKKRHVLKTTEVRFKNLVAVVMNSSTMQVRDCYFKAFRDMPDFPGTVANI